MSLYKKFIAHYEFLLFQRERRNNIFGAAAP